MLHRMDLQEKWLAGLLDQAQSDDRVLAVWLAGSLGRGEGDRYSDVDVHLLVQPDSVEGFREASGAWLEQIRPLVLFTVVFEGRMINAMTVDGLRLDVWFHDAAPEPLDPASTRVVWSRDELRIATETAASMAAPQLLEPLLKEFWRCIALTPAVLGRDELIVSWNGLSYEVGVVCEMAIAAQGRVRDRGVKRLNRFLPADFRHELQAALPAPNMTAVDLAQAHLALAGLVQRYGPRWAAERDTAYPHELEAAVLVYVRSELTSLGLLN